MAFMQDLEYAGGVAEHNGEIDCVGRFDRRASPEQVTQAPAIDPIAAPGRSCRLERLARVVRQDKNLAAR